MKLKISIFQFKGLIVATARMPNSFTPQQITKAEKAAKKAHCSFSTRNRWNCSTKLNMRNR